jgi:hypothetical protein
MPRPGRFTSALALSGVTALLAAAPAGASFHLNMIREVSPESAPGASDAFVELQMYAPGQNFVSAHTVRFYNAAGDTVHNRVLSGSDPANGDSQRTILIGDTAVPGRDFTISGMSSEIAFTGPGGAICFDEGLIDCVSFGAFNNGGPMAGLGVGTAAPAVPAGSSLTRTIARGCSTLLDPPDDTDNSGADFAVGSRTPRPNATAPTETACGGGGGGGGDTDPPQTSFTLRPLQQTTDRTPTFRFRSDEPRSTFQCSLDGRRFRSCSSPFTTARLARGLHVLRVRARDRAGNRDPTPARDTFRVVRPQQVRG